MTRSTLEERMELIADKAAEKAAHKAVAELMQRMGIDVDDHLGTQQDLAYLRKLRRSSESITAKVLLGLVTVAVSAIGGWILLGFKTWSTGG